MHIKKNLICFILIVMVKMSFSQNDTLNRRDEKNLKTGYWLVHYDEFVKETKDSSKAIYKGYEYYINGVAVRYVMDKTADKKLKIKYNPIDPLKDKELLNGIILFYDQNNVAVYKAEFTNGFVTKLHSYTYIKSDGSFELMDEELVNFTNPHASNPHSYYYEFSTYKIFKEAWKIKKCYYVFDGKNWKKIKI